jgi:glucosamine kinase
MGWCVSADPVWVVGVDGGGTRGRAWMAPADHDPAAAPAGAAERDEPCNAYAVGVERAAAAILGVIDDARHAAGAPSGALADAFVCIGVAGVDRAHEREPLHAALLAGGLHRDRLDLQSDPWVALEGALPAEVVGHGARLLLVAGTGSAAVAITAEGRRVRVGGWGARVGDEGSGAWLGIEAVRATLHALDGRDPPGELSTAVQAAWGAGAEALVGRARTATPADFASLAPLVLRAEEDPVAAALRARAVASLCALITTAAAGGALRERRAADDAPAPVGLALAGGVAAALEDDLRTSLPPALAAAMRAPVGPPVAGAWRLARARARA